MIHFYWCDVLTEVSSGDCVRLYCIVVQTLLKNSQEPDKAGLFVKHNSESLEHSHIRWGEQFIVDDEEAVCPVVFLNPPKVVRREEGWALPIYLTHHKKRRRVYLHLDEVFYVNMEYITAFQRGKHVNLRMRPGMKHVKVYGIWCAAYGQQKLPSLLPNPSWTNHFYFLSCQLSLCLPCGERRNRSLRWLVTPEQLEDSLILSESLASSTSLLHDQNIWLLHS